MSDAHDLLMDLAIAAGDAFAGRRMSDGARGKLQRSYDAALAFLRGHMRELEAISADKPPAYWLR